MSCERVQRLLEDLVEGVLDADEWMAAEEHLKGCDRCRRRWQAGEELRRRTADLPRTVMPERELWPGIAAAIEGQRLARVRFGRPLRTALAAAAVAVLVVGALVAAFLAGRDRGAPALVERSPASSVQTVLAAGETGRAELERARSELESALDQRRGELSPETLAVVDRNLRIIDQAIADISAALAGDPANPQLARQLADVQRRQVKLLERATRLPAEI